MTDSPTDLSEFHDELHSRSGRIARLWVVANVLRIAPRRPDAHPLAEPATKAAQQLVTDLQ